MRWASGVSEKHSPHDALAECFAMVSEGLNGEPADLVLVFVSAHFQHAYSLVPHLVRDGLSLAPGAVVVQNVDQPTRHDIVDRLLDALNSGDLSAGGADVVQPSYRGQAGHPVVVRGSLLDELAAVTEETLGLRDVLARHEPALLAMDDEPVVRLDLNTPDSLDEGRRLLGVAN